MLIVIVAMLVAALLYGLWEAHWIRPVTYEVSVPGLAPEFSGFSILHLSDLHGRVGVFSRPVFRRWLQGSDLVAVTGDLYQPGLGRRRLAAELNRLREAHPVVLVSGNHDYHRRRLAIDPLPTGDWLLDNRVRSIQRGDAELVVAGIPDLVLGRPDWSAVLQELGSGPAVLLSHRPDAVLLPQASRFQLILAGHTHGGQVVFPIVGALLKHNRIGQGYVAGRRDVPGEPVLITSRGLGTSELPVRFLCRPELVRVILRAPVEPGGGL